MKSLLLLLFCLNTIAYAQCAYPNETIVTVAGGYNQIGTYFGIEGGIIGDESRFSLFAGGDIYQTNKVYNLNKNIIGGSVIGFYIKGMYRLIRTKSNWCIYVTASPGLINEDIDFSTGIKILCPISERFAISAEPTYLVNAHILNTSLCFHIWLN